MRCVVASISVSLKPFISRIGDTCVLLVNVSVNTSVIELVCVSRHNSRHVWVCLKNIRASRAFEEVTKDQKLSNKMCDFITNA